MSLPIVESIKEVYSVTDSEAYDHVGHFTIVARDPNAGGVSRYSVIRVDYQSGFAECIGRELPLKLARRVAAQKSMGRRREQCPL